MCFLVGTMMGPDRGSEAVPAAVWVLFSQNGPCANEHVLAGPGVCSRPHGSLPAVLLRRSLVPSCCVLASGPAWVPPCGRYQQLVVGP